jgi:hypothetical protein
MILVLTDVNTKRYGFFAKYQYPDGNPARFARIVVFLIDKAVF